MERVTKAELAQLTPLLLPAATRRGVKLPRFNKQAAMFSLELAAAAYTFDTKSFREADWVDQSFLADGRILSGKAANGAQDSRIWNEVSELMLKHTIKKIRSKNVISQAIGTYRQREDCDTLKALVMIRKDELSDIYVVAIGFMGTGKRIYDWISNLRLAPEEGIHSGFIQLASDFEENTQEMVFEQTGKQLGLKSLTMTDILEECKLPNSRFRLWMSGHSQGSAVMQVYQYHLLQSGVRREYMMGYGFASPKTIRNGIVPDPRDYPMYHIINSDDAVPRVGGDRQLGKCITFTADEIMRTKCFGPQYNDKNVQKARNIMAMVRVTADAYMLTIGFLRAVRNISDEDTAQLIRDAVGHFLPGMAIDKLTDKVDIYLEKAETFVKAEYEKSGLKEQIREEKVDLFTRSFSELIASVGLKGTSDAMVEAALRPHRLYNKGDPDHAAAYQYIVNERFFSLSDDAHKCNEWITSPRNGRIREELRTLPGQRRPRKRKIRLNNVFIRM